MSDRLSAAVAAVVLLLAQPGAASALPTACGTADGTAREPMASDALFVLRGAVGIAGTCGPCLCDTNSSGAIGATDALMTLRRAVGGETPLQCPSCPCVAVSRLATGERPSSVIAVDLDKDGFTDLVTADLDAAEVSILYGRGRGVFAPREAIPVDPTPQSVTAADLDGNGFLDLIVCDALPNGLTILLGSESGEFTKSGSVVPTGEAPINSVALDLDGDDKMDLVVANSLSNDISVLFGNGNGTFKPEQRYAVGSGPRWVGLLDVDGDEIPDVITANRDSNDLSVLHGEGGGVFSDEKRISVPTGPYHISLGDLDGNSHTDLVVSCYYETGVAVLLAGDDHEFADPVFYPTQAHAIQSSLARIDDDSALDIAAANFDGDGMPGVALLLGNGDGTFAAAKVFDTGRKSRSVVTTDIDGDSTIDAIVANAGQHEDDLTILHGTGDGSFVTALQSQASAQTQGMTVADFDADGVDDVATADGAQSQSVTVSLGDGNGHFDRTTHPVGSVPYTVHTGRIDEDDVPDLIASADSPEEAEYGQRAFALFGQDNGAFELGPESTHLTDGEPIRGNLAVADIDGDDAADIAVGTGDQVKFFRSLTDGSFQSFLDLPASQTFPGVALADVDDDGDVDLFEFSRAEHLVFLHRNTGDGDFDQPEPHTVAAGSTMAVQDVTGDGAVDVVTTDWHLADDGLFDGTISVLIGDGQGGFAPEILSTPREILQTYTLADFDRDGAVDLALAVVDGILVLPGDAKGHFGASASASPVLVPTSRTFAALDSGRFDSGSGLDLVGAGYGEGLKNRLVVLPQLGNCMIR